jgi:CheY-like chemotaxis protein
MSTEQNQPGTPEYSGGSTGSSEGAGEGSAVAGQSAGPNGAGPGPGRFRRRRRRKKSGGGGQNLQASGQTADGAANSSANGSANGATAEGGATAEFAQARPAQAGGQQGQQNQTGQGEGGQRRRRKKKGGKKFFQGGSQQAQPGNRQPTHQPGNTFSGGGGFGNGGGGRRNKKRSGGGRQFVGPMDHSYRAVNGNYAENPPSTIQVNGNHGRSYNHNAHMQDSGHQSQFLPTFYEPPAPVIKEDAPVRVFCIIEDLFVTAKITEAARKLGVKVAFIKGEKDDIARITDAPEGERPNLVILDLNNANAKPLTVIPKIRAKLKKSVAIVGFLSHLQGDLKAKAVEAGCDSVMPRAAFSQGLVGLLRRYGLEEEPELNDAQPTYFQ